ncbi:hypothetical protein [Streptomyces sp. CBMA152]|uniref:hypothetical protein n=1 Tax=Streptomyces sp. CBMA152 TaxID=1896312 RepID=UPI001660B296|nr:hypothetical protein [Streptomyces sp. CBMA152]
MGAGGNPATADFGTNGIPAVRELAPRCDNIPKGIAPGCVLPFFKPTNNVDTNLYPAAGACYWLMQQKMPTHPHTCGLYGRMTVQPVNSTYGCSGSE